MYKVQTVDVQGSQMEVFLYDPKGEGPHPGLVLAQHIPVGHTGIENDEFTLKAAERLAENGYCVAVPFIFHWWSKDEDIVVKRDESRDDWMVADIKAAFDLLAERDDVDADRIGIVGHCWGGRVAWLGACHIPALAACAIFYGGRIKIGMGNQSRPPIELASDINCPLIGFFGKHDKNPSPSDVDDYAAALDQAGVPHTFHSYDGAGHAFQNFPTPERYREAQSEDAWEKLFGFLNRELNPNQP
jgi:carboxymethylenebutenolidase